MNRSPALLALAVAFAPSVFAEGFDEDPELRDALSGIHAEAGRFRVPAEPLAGALEPPAAGPRSPSRYPVRGIDVSRYQDDVDWTEVKGAGISFAFIKATENDDIVDRQFLRNWRGAAAAGVLRGAYHFFHVCEPGAAQAAHFIRTVPRDPDALPPVVDLERSSACERMPSVKTFRREAGVFLRRVEPAYGKKPILYASLEIYESYLKGWSEDRLWITEADGSPKFPDDQRFLFWQYSARGQVPGIGWRVDLDVFNGTPAELAALASDGTQTAFR